MKSKQSKRLGAVARKLEQAFKPMPYDNVRHEYTWLAHTNKVITKSFFSYKGVELRMDYSFDCDEKLPGVDVIRQLSWKDVPSIYHREIQKRVKYYNGITTSTSNLTSAMNYTSNTATSTSYSFKILAKSI